jgi:hypothetical protein
VTPCRTMSAYQPGESPYAKFVGKPYEEAKAELQKMHPEFQIQSLPQGAMVTRDHKEDRIRVMFDPQTKLVVGVPRVG